MKKRLFGILLSFALMLTMMPVLGLSQTAYADADTWSENKSFDSDASFESGVNVTNDITVTIAEGKTVTVGNGIYAEGKTLTVEGKGSLIVNGYNSSGGSGGSAFTGSIIVKGGKVTLTGGEGGKGENDTGGNGIEGNVEVSGGSFSATGGNGHTVGRAVVSSNTITCKNGIVAQESANGSEWSDISAARDKQYVRTIQTYPLWVGGVQVTSANATNITGSDPVTASYTPATTGENPTPATLKLNGYSYKDAVGDKNAAIYAEEDLIIETTGDNNVENTSTEDNTCAIWVDGDLTLQGSGKLNASGVHGLQATNDVIIKNGTVIAIATKTDNNNVAIYANNITIEGGNVEATGIVGIQAYENLMIKGGVIRATGKSAGIGGLTVTINNGTIEATATDNVSFGIVGGGDGVTINGGQVTASGSKAGIFGYVKNSIAGTGWTNTAGTEGKADIEESAETGRELNYKKVQFPTAHTHDFTYSADGATITATCSAEGCDLPEVGGKHVATLTIAAPLHTTYGDGKDAAAQITDANSIQGEAKVKYYTKTGGTYGSETETPPTDAGDYKVSITLGPGTDQKTATASVEYTIAKATPTITAVPTAAAITYGQTLENSTLSGGTAKLGDNIVAGTFAWKTKTTAPSVADSQATEYDVVFTPTDTDNYNTAECKVKLTVNKKEVGLSWTNISLTYNGQEQAPTATATELVSGDEGKVSVTVTGGQTDASATAYTAEASELTGDRAGNYTLPNDKTTSFTISPKSISEATVTLSATSLPYTGSSQTVTVSGVKLGETDLSTSDYDVSGQTSGTDIGTYAVTVVGKGNYKDSATAQWSITQAAPTIATDPTASDITYGQTLSDSKLTGGKAKVGDTEISGTFSWKNGSTKPSVADSGETEYTVVFTPTDTTKYKPAETKVTLTVKKAEPTAAAVTANNRKYDGTKKPLVKADESILSGGTMQYALGSDDKTAPDKGWGESIPEAAEKGEYYVWYQVKGDANHKDSAPQAVTVTISEKDPEPNESTITFDLNGGTLNGKTGKVTVTAANGTVITLPAPTRDGYTFDYWEGSKYNAGDQYTVNGDHTFKAVWKTADKDGSKGGSSSGKNGVKTGDTNDLAGLIALMLASGGALGAIGYRRRKEH